ncbi:MAG: hypothetical protein M3246_03440 [Actinomycetota bacterium]|nr:hypothetical protein [Actinomycetota bacterium]
MELKNKEQLRAEILQSWVKNAWVYPVRGPENETFLRLTPGGRLKMRRRIGEFERSLGIKGSDVLKQEEAGTLPVERDKLELAMMVQAYASERRIIESQGIPLGTAAVRLEEDASEGHGGTTEPSGR